MQHEGVLVVSRDGLEYIGEWRFALSEGGALVDAVVPAERFLDALSTEAQVPRLGPAGCSQGLAIP